MPLTIDINRAVDLEGGALEQALGLKFVSGDMAAHRLNVTLRRGGAPADLTGATVLGRFVRADGATVDVYGEASGNVASVTFDSACYAVPGRLDINLQVTQGGATVTPLILHAVIRRGGTNVVVDPGGIIPDLSELLGKIDEVETAVFKADAASEGADAAAGEALRAGEAARLAAREASAAAGSIDGLTVSAETLPSTGQAEAAVSDADGHKHIAFALPRGIQGVRGTRTFTGAAVTGTSAAPAPYPTGIPEAVEGDRYQYVGPDHENIGNEYRCTLGGPPEAALWVYEQNLRGAPGEGAVNSVCRIYPDTWGNVALTGAELPAGPEDGLTVAEALEARVKVEDIADNLATTVAGKALDARQGKALSDALALKQDEIGSDNAASVRAALGLKLGATREVQRSTATIAASANSTVTVSIDFPAPFSGTPSVAVSLNTSAPADRTLAVTAVSATGMTVVLYNGTSYTGNLVVYWIAAY